jgi:hypothetical protein
MVKIVEMVNWDNLEQINQERGKTCLRRGSESVQEGSECDEDGRGKKG